MGTPKYTVRGLEHRQKVQNYDCFRLFSTVFDCFRLFFDCFFIKKKLPKAAKIFWAIVFEMHLNVDYLGKVLRIFEYFEYFGLFVLDLTHCALHYSILFWEGPEML